MSEKKCSKCNLLLDVEEDEYGKYTWCPWHTCENYHNIIILETKDVKCPNCFDGKMMTHLSSTGDNKKDLLIHKCNKCGLTD